MSSLLTLLAGVVILLAALVTVTRRNPIHAALSMLVALGGVALLMLGLRSSFLAAMQVLLYGGAIMVLFVFVIMLLTLRDEEMGPEPPQSARMFAAAGAFGTLAVLWFGLGERGGPQVLPPPAVGDGFGSAAHFSRFLYTDYAVAVELVAVLVMAAAAGVTVMARRHGQASLEGTKLAGPAHEPAHGHAAAPGHAPGAEVHP